MLERIIFVVFTNVAPMIIFKNLKKMPKGDFPKDVVVTVSSGVV